MVVRVDDTAVAPSSQVAGDDLVPVEQVDAPENGQLLADFYATF